MGTTITLNPVTAANMTRTLRRILASDQINFSDSIVTDIVKKAGGDLRNASQMLQFLCLEGSPGRARNGGDGKVARSVARNRGHSFEPLASKPHRMLLVALL